MCEPKAPNTFHWKPTQASERTAKERFPGPWTMATRRRWVRMGERLIHPVDHPEEAIWVRIEQLLDRV